MATKFTFSSAEMTRLVHLSIQPTNKSFRDEDIVKAAAEILDTDSGSLRRELQVCVRYSLAGRLADHHEKLVRLARQR